jgi:UTP--glucose-1-phosphate uridylyltransferase
LVDYVIEELRMCGVTHALFIVSEQKPQIQQYLGSVVGTETDELPALHIDYAFQREPRGSGHAVLCASEWAKGEPVAVVFGDCVIESPDTIPPLARLMNVFGANSAAAAILVETVNSDQVHKYGIVDPAPGANAELDEPFPLRDIVEKPTAQTAPSNRAAAARWVISGEVMEELRHTPNDSRGEINLPDAIRRVLGRGGSGWAVPLRQGEARRDIGSPESYMEQFVRVALRDPAMAHQFGSELSR